MQLNSYSYAPESVSSGILHIGVGNFHRAHQQYYINQLLEDEDQQVWGICGVCLLPSDQNIVQHLRSQNLGYTLTVCSTNGEKEVHTIGSLRELIWGIEQPDAVVQKIADPAIKIITLTITEGGYNINKETNQFDLNDERVRQDVAQKNNPTTVFGFVALGLRMRRDQNNGGLTILCCDNLQHNGNTAKKAFLSFMQAQDAELAQWVAVNVTFPNSMVDRITPATTPADIERLNGISGVNDKAPVYCEDFIQWVIEDKFIAGRPALDRVGVEFTDDVSAYENMKLSLLNASHTLLSYPSFLKGYRKVDEAMQDAAIAKLVRDFMDIDITPYVPAPPGTNLAHYKQTLLKRFANHSVSDQVSRLCFDGISKFPVYIVPNLVKITKDEKDTIRLAFLIASYRHYLKYRQDENGAAYNIAEPAITTEDQALLISEEAIDFLNLSAFKQAGLQQQDAFVHLYLAFAAAIKNKGITETLASVVR